MRENDFDKVAPFYDFLSTLVFGKTLLSAQLAFIHKIKGGSRVLIIGGGTGRFLKTLLEKRPDVVVDYVEASEKMIQLSQRRVRRYKHVQFIHGTERDVPEIDYDVIITHFFLDVFADPEVVVAELKQRLSARGIWLCADFQATGKWRHELMLWLMHRFFAIASGLQAKRIAPIKGIMDEHGLVLTEVKYWRKELIFSGCFTRQHVAI